MDGITYINNAIREISISDIFTTQAMIIYNEKGAALMMPTGGEGSDGKRYKIWTNLSSRKEAESIAKEWGSDMHNIQFCAQKEEELPDDPEILLCNYFILNFNK